jgi:CPA2 family monovalent cation:H+ antiporter-2
LSFGQRPNPSLVIDAASELSSNFAERQGILSPERNAMPPGPSLVATIVVSLTLAYVGGVAARALRLPPLVGYLVAGIAVGPFTPGFIADQRATAELAEIGVALLLFGVGLHFSVADLVAVWRVAVPGAILQLAVSAGLGMAVGNVMGLGAEGAVILGLAVAVASTAVATRALEQRGRLHAPSGRIALGWLVMQDLVVVAALVVLPDPAGSHPAALAGSAAAAVGLKLAGVIAFVAAMLLIGRRVIPWVLERTARDGSRELFRLAVIVVALGIAYLSATLVGVSLALGAFFAGIVLAESDVSHQAAGESVPVQQIFTVLFFVSVGMLFDPAVLLRATGQLLALLAVIVLGNALAALLVLLALRAAPAAAVEVAASLAQIGEFSFILTGLAVERGLLPAEPRNLVLAASLLSIMANPFLFRLAGILGPRLDRAPLLRRWHSGGRAARTRAAAPLLAAHAIIVGHGRVGSVVAASLGRAGIPYIVIEQNLRFAEQLREEGVPVIYGDAGWPEVLGAARPEKARLLIIAVPDRSATRRIIAAARDANPKIDVVVRTHTGEEADWLAGQAVGRVVMAERHAANEIADYALTSFRGRGEEG